MLIRLNYPPGWFRDADSHKICKLMNLPMVNASAWANLKDLPLSIYTIIPGFNAVNFALTNKLYVLEFVDYDTYFVHPSSFEKILRRHFKRILKKELHKRVV